VGMPLLAGLSIVHGTLPPHPAAMLAATQYPRRPGADDSVWAGRGLPAAALAGPGLGWLMMRRWEKRKAKLAGVSRRGDDRCLRRHGGRGRSTLSTGRSDGCGSCSRPAGPIRAAAAILLPVALIFLGSWADSLPRRAACEPDLHFVGSPDIALLIAVLVALVTLGGTSRPESITAARAAQAYRESFEPIARCW
jgi:gluconate:H+ symporter, GntP family